jgi:hypothetical protein
MCVSIARMSVLTDPLVTESDGLNIVKSKGRRWIGPKPILSPIKLIFL